MIEITWLVNILIKSHLFFVFTTGTRPIRSPNLIRGSVLVSSQLQGIELWSSHKIQHQSPLNQLTIAQLFFYLSHISINAT
jgi:hypothetical protein